MALAFSGNSSNAAFVASMPSVRASLNAGAGGKPSTHSQPMTGKAGERINPRTIRGTRT